MDGPTAYDHNGSQSQMKIAPPKAGFTNEATIISDLETLLKQPDANELRPCENCGIKCSCSRSPHCACQCSATCCNIPVALSIEPDRYPIEPAIAKLVFELNTLRLFQTCWSCEGHRNSHGAANKMPRIWFYTPSPIYCQLIVQHLSALMCAHKLTYRWIIQITNLGNEIYSTYSLEPSLNPTTQPDIQMLHNDLKIISEDFSRQIKRIAEANLQQLNQVLNEECNYDQQTRKKLA